MERLGAAPHRPTTVRPSAKIEGRRYVHHRFGPSNRVSEAPAVPMFVNLRGKVGKHPDARKHGRSAFPFPRINRHKPRLRPALRTACHITSVQQWSKIGP